MNVYACPSCTKDLCEDCFNHALSGISTANVPISYTSLKRKMTTDDYLEQHRAKHFRRAISRKQYAPIPTYNFDR